MNEVVNKVMINSYDLQLHNAMNLLRDASGIIPHVQPNITFAMIKRDALEHAVDSKIMDVIRMAGFVPIWSVRDIKFTSDKIKRFYIDHADKPYFTDLYHSICRVTPMVLEHRSTRHSAVTMLRTLVGATNAREAVPGTIRHRFAGHIFNSIAPMADNAIHASESLTEMLRELSVVLDDRLKGIGKLRSLTYGDFYLRDIDPLYTYPEG